ncbi:MAG: hypothetical protein A2655_01175 [Candidatus Yanofskybacteria bacterium RIFCSPHIGHO2_01_FULL_43_42]|uniref:Reverse transcriptase domain-containing protein n=1 Tax=Candidatus Yanofskybacteria bacterium RIFCSPLOWO2_01_FULL_43_22 TaxID=1802695 RepID=A0A1F8GFF5_9BACT|nr:MAG: hypothetical protein A2655_01175 [Candidatus Yanofskybacteria bacterium RIFCSPHIGHO2_01_FULL_43_42]OGN12418.1 MAG: hypothetical protein A3D48_01905 [Candidatus Yanofskybacteria bacterium RIFCSPHIGHO2_02_FULL_43_17]OGN23790.1 MAG: hypothetical protein A3A13_01965 [Candidatus Yanofskybacteria bacterium RIFCSPLOWO2_01_FULL_43_22]
MKIKFTHNYESVISLENLLEAWKEFIIGKRSRKDVQEFERDLMTNVIQLHNDLVTMSYGHHGYEAFKISDPKPRNIHKASVRDRVLHRALYRVLYPFFDRTFISDSYSCRYNKATYKAIDKFRKFFFQVSKNDKKTVWVLKCDIRKFFASVNHDTLKAILKNYISDDKILFLLWVIIDSFSVRAGIGLPLGNLTSQLFVNIYMNEFDQFMKHKLKAKYYIRYADDFVVMSHDKSRLQELLPKIGDFLQERLRLDLHPNKISIRTIASGVDFLGWVHFPNYRVLRTTTKRRMFKRINKNPKPETINSYLGLLKHGNSRMLEEKIMDC